MSAIESRFFDSADGLRLHYLDVRPATDGGLPPAVCLPGLTRSALDFERLARALAADGRRVLAFDYRGRGDSQHDPDWRHYDLATERGDFLLALRQNGIADAHFIGTSRGGLHIMALASADRAIIRSAVLNDIGPKLEASGLARIKSYVGEMVRPKSLDEAVKVLKIGSGLHFDRLTPDEWRVFATTTFGHDETDLHLRYDPALARTLEAFDLAKPLPEMWEQFDRLAGLPLLAIRGANSDLLSDATFEAMTRHRPACEAITVAGQGHAPLLADSLTIGRIVGFLRNAD